MFKEKYSSDELNELIGWFRERMDKLPSELVINEFTRTENLQKTVTSLIALVNRPKLDVIFSGYVAQLFRIRDVLMEQGME